MNNPILSIVVPIFNCENYIEDCLSSIVDELASSDELLIIDDGSTDESSDRAQRLIADCRNSRLILKNNGGVSSARNLGLVEAKGEYIMFVDADDMLVPGWRSTIGRAIQCHESADIIIFAKQCDCANSYRAKDLIDALIGFDNGLVLQAGASVWSKLYKLAPVNAYGIRFNEDIIHGEDALFNIEMLLHAESLWFEDASIYCYRLSESSATHSFSERFLSSNLLYLEQLSAILAKSSDFGHSHIEDCVDLSFVNSVFLYAKRLASSKNLRTIIVGSRLFYRNRTCAQLLARAKPRRGTSSIVITSYVLTKAGMLAPLALLFSLFLRIKSQKEKWVEI